MKTPVEHSSEAEGHLRQVLDSGANVDVNDIKAIALWTLDCDSDLTRDWDNAWLMSGQVWIYYSPWVKGDELEQYEGVMIGEMSVYRFHHGMAATVIGDCIDQDLYEAGEAMRIVTEEYANDELYLDGLYQPETMGKHRYLLERFDLLPKYQKKRLGHASLHIGLQAAGCEGFPVFVMPSKIEDDAGWQFLKDFYMGMDTNTLYVEEFNTVCAPDYNSGRGVLKARQGDIAHNVWEGFEEVEDGDEG